MTIKPASQPTGQGLRVLIADDNQSDRMILQAIVRREGHEVLLATDGREAVELFKQHSPDIVLMDALMPVMNGLEASRAIKALADSDLVPIIFLTSLQDAESLAECLDSGGDDFMSKPYNRVILKAKINAFSRMRVMHAQLQRHNRQMLLEQQVAKTVFDNVAHSGCLNLPNIQHSLSPMAVFNGDTVLAERKPDGGMLLFLGDFTGHGLPAAIGAMPLAEIFYGMTSKGFSMEEVLREVNSKLCKILPVGVFCCGAMVELNFHNKSARVWVGGVPDVYLFREQSGKVERFASTHLPLGVLDPQEFDPHSQDVVMHNGDRVFLWSDGIVESRNSTNEMFGEDRLNQVFASTDSPDLIFQAILDQVDRFMGGSDRDDDITLVTAKMVDIEQIGMTTYESSKGSIGGPVNWTLSLALHDQSLAAFNPLPLVMNLLMEVEGLRPLGGQLYTLLAELFSNALEHGVLELDSSLKTGPQGFGQYYLRREQALAALSNGSVRLTLTHRPLPVGGELIMEVTDTGTGFDYANYGDGDLTTDAQSATDHLADSVLRPNVNWDYSGRGITLIQQLSDELTYLDEGRSVRAVVRWPRNGVVVKHTGN
ncbi:SpoIIE family protein phosphatase [Saccharospirillum sp.]|uniref:ATP-binding SpoIIE family protein phosphatase n=1 Tax=Saccharospirillum sp. TaxID=2033801 RepID=UPI0034A0A0C9